MLDEESRKRYDFFKRVMEMHAEKANVFQCSYPDEYKMSWNEGCGVRRVEGHFTFIDRAEEKWTEDVIYREILADVIYDLPPKESCGSGCGDCGGKCKTSKPKKIDLPKKKGRSKE